MHNNNMEKLLNKIERRLGTRLINLPKELQKESWIEVINDDTLDTFSRFYPHIFLYQVNADETSIVDGKYYLIDEEIVEGIEILGVKDVAFKELGHDAASMYNSSDYGYYNFGATYSIEDIFLSQMRANQTSLFNNGIYVDFIYPNKICLKSASDETLNFQMRRFPVYLLIKHDINLTTIAPTKMETFEELATCDVAMYLWNQLKFFNDLETVFGTINLKLEDLERYKDRREEIVNTMKDNYLNADNQFQPIMYTV